MKILWLVICNAPSVTLILDARTLSGRVLLLEAVGPCTVILSADQANALARRADLAGGISL